MWWSSIWTLLHANGRRMAFQWQHPRKGKLRDQGKWRWWCRRWLCRWLTSIFPPVKSQPWWGFDSDDDDNDGKYDDDEEGDIHSGVVIWITITKLTWAGQSEVNTIPIAITTSRTNSLSKALSLCECVCLSWCACVYLYVSVFVRVWAGRSAYWSGVE